MFSNVVSAFFLERGTEPRGDVQFQQDGSIVQGDGKCLSPNDGTSSPLRGFGMY